MNPLHHGAPPLPPPADLTVTEVGGVWGTTKKEAPEAAATEGLTFAAVLAFVDSIGGAQAVAGLTTAEVVEFHVKQKTAADAIAYVELVRRSSASAVGPANVFISHAWSYLFTDLVDALRPLAEEGGGCGGGCSVVLLWLDIFCANQHAALDLAFAWWSATFVASIRAIGRTVMVLLPWRDPRPLTRAWCLWELFCTVQSGAAFEVLLPAAERLDFERTLVADFGAVALALSTVDVQRAEAHKPEDRDAIFAAVAGAPGGAEHLNATVLDLLRAWLLSSGRAALAAVPTEERATSSLLRNLALLLVDLGKLAEAEELSREELEGLQFHLGPKHPDTLASLNNLANLLKDQGKLTEAEALHREALAGRTAQLGRQHRSTLAALEDLANLLSTQGKLAEAEPLYREALAGLRVQLGAKHLSTHKLLNNLAVLLTAKDGEELEEAEELSREALKGLRGQLGPKHPDTLAALNNLAGLLKDRSKLAEAEALHREALAGRTAQLGQQHPSTLASLNNLANLLKDQGKLEEAETLYREALEGHRAHLGEQHPSTGDSSYNLASLLEAQGKLAEAHTLYTAAAEAYQAAYGCNHEQTLDAQRRAYSSTTHGASRHLCCTMS